MKLIIVAMAYRLFFFLIFTVTVSSGTPPMTNTVKPSILLMPWPSLASLLMVTVHCVPSLMLDFRFSIVEESVSYYWMKGVG